MARWSWTTVVAAPTHLHRLSLSSPRPAAMVAAANPGSFEDGREGGGGWGTPWREAAGAYVSVPQCIQE
jgi:hypothetical protein